MTVHYWKYQKAWRVPFSFSLAFLQSYGVFKYYPGDYPGASLQTALSCRLPVQVLQSSINYLLCTNMWEVIKPRLNKTTSKVKCNTMM